MRISSVWRNARICDRKRREVLRKMAALTSLSFLGLLCTLVLKTTPLPTQAAGVSVSSAELSRTRVDDTRAETPQYKSQSGGDTLSQLRWHQRALQYASSQDYDRDSPGGVDGLIVAKPGRPRRKGGLLSRNALTDYSSGSTVIQMDTQHHQTRNPPQEYKIAHIPLTLFRESSEDVTRDNTDDESVNSRHEPLMIDNSHHPNKSIHFTSELNQGSYSGTSGVSNRAASQRLSRPFKMAKPNRNASFRNTSEIPVQRLPQALIIGVKKSGTRALLEFLRIHPDIEGPGPEPHFFDRNYHLGLDWYRSVMPKTYQGQITVEKTPSYFVTREAPARIQAMNPDMKLLLVVRDPVTRAVSDYCQAASKRRMPPFEQMAMKNPELGVVNASWGAVRIGVYTKHMEKWLHTFPRKQIHLVDGRKLISEPARELAKVERFLQLPAFISPEHFYLNRFKGSFPCLRRKGKAHCLDERNKGRSHPQVRPSVLERLRDFYRPYNAKFYQQVGQDFGWSD